MNLIESLKKSWEFFSVKPGGKWIFSKMLSKAIPYSGTVKPYISSFGDGSAEVQIHDRRIIRNHLNSVHALALSNVGEMTTGLALHSLMPKTHRAILVSLHTEYLKKARGTLTSKSKVTHSEWLDSEDIETASEVFDLNNDVVARTKTVWKVSKFVPRAEKA